MRFVLPPKLLMDGTLTVAQRSVGEPQGPWRRGKGRSGEIGHFSSPPKVVERPGLQWAGSDQTRKETQIATTFLENVSEVIRDPGGYRWQASLLPAASLSTLTTWVSDGQSLLPPGSPCPSCPPWQQEWQQHTNKAPHGTDWDALKSLVCIQWIVQTKGSWNDLATLTTVLKSILLLYTMLS